MPHTPGPWKHRPAGKWTQLLDDGRTVEHENPDHVVAEWRDSEGRTCIGFVCICSSTTLPDADNARLIAAAPALLDALRGAVLSVEWSAHVEHGPKGFDPDPDAYAAQVRLAQKCSAAIAKAEGTAAALAPDKDREAGTASTSKEGQ